MTQFFSIVTGLLSIILGIILIAMLGVLSTILAIALGIWIILSSANVISISIAVRKKYSSWFLLLLLGIVNLLVAISLPKKGEQTVVIISPRDDGYYDVKATRM